MKRLHKISAALLAVCLSCTMGTTVFAAENTTLDENHDSGDTIVNATTKIPGQPTYTINIPSTIPVGEINKTSESSIKSTSFNVTAASVADLNGKQVNVTVATADGDFNLVDTNANKLPYQVFNVATNGTALVSGGLFTSFTADGAVTGRVDIDQANIEVAGEYTGILTFTIALADPAVS